jgi:phage tail-like protein
MPNRTAPYPSYNYLVTVTSSIGVVSTLGGFTKALGLTTGSTAVTLQRGVVSASVLVPWMNQARVTPANAWQSVLITLRGESGQTTMSWRVGNATPASYIGPALSGKVQSDVALQELVLTVGSVQLIAPVSFIPVTRFGPIIRF